MRKISWRGWLILLVLLIVQVLDRHCGPVFHGGNMGRNSATTHGQHGCFPRFSPARLESMAKT
jgi:hypothetical protein